MKSVLNKRAQAVQTKSVFWILGVLVFAVFIFILFKMDLFGYIKSLPSFGQVESGDKKLPDDEVIKNVGCGEGMVVVGKISEEQIPPGDSFWSKTWDKMKGWFGWKKDVRYFYDVQPLGNGKQRIQKDKNLYVVNEPLPQKLFYRGSSGGVSFLGVFDTKTKSFKIFSKLNQPGLCKKELEGKDSGYFYFDSKYEKTFDIADAIKFKEDSKYGCNLLVKLSGSSIFADRYLCKEKQKVIEIELKEFTPECKKINSYGFVREILDNSGSVLVEIKNPLCENPSTKPIEITFKNNGFAAFWGWIPSLSLGQTTLYSPTSFFWNAEANGGKGKAYVRSDEIKDEKKKGPWGYEDLVGREKNCRTYFPDMGCKEDDFANILKILETKTLNEFIFAIASIGVRGGNWFTGIKEKKNPIIIRKEIREKILDASYLVAWINPGTCKKKEKLFTCKIGKDEGDCVLAEKCAYCFVDTPVEKRVCGKTCLCPKNYEKEGYVIKEVIGDQICEFNILNGGRQKVSCKLL